MAMESSTRSPKHWHQRADHARALADCVGEPEVRQLLREVAHRYERIATILQTRPIGIGGSDHYR